MKMISKKCIAFLLLLVLLASILSGCNSASMESFQKLEHFEHAKIGVLTGSVYEDFAKERFPYARRDYYSMFSDMIVAVEQEKIDGYLSESTYVTAAIWEGAKIRSIDEAIDHTQAGFIFQKSEASALLREQMNSFVLAAKENGTLKALNEKWFGKTEWFKNLWKPTLDRMVEKLNGNGVEDTPYEDKEW